VGSASPDPVDFTVLVLDLATTRREDFAKALPCTGLTARTTQSKVGIKGRHRPARRHPPARRETRLREAAPAPPFEHMLDYSSGEATCAQDQPGQFDRNPLDEPQDVVEYWAVEWSRHGKYHQPALQAGSGLGLSADGATFGPEAAAENASA
jgi:hypothetical protein